MGEIVDELIRVGLMFGAVFQLICIAAVIWVPAKDESRDVVDSSDDDMSVEGNTVSNYQRSLTGQLGHGRRSRHEKKKRR